MKNTTKNIDKVYIDEAVTNGVGSVVISSVRVLSLVLVLGITVVVGVNSLVVILN